MPRGLLGSFQDFDQAPAFAFTQRASLHDAYGITDVAGVFLIMGHEFGSLFHELAVDGVLELTLYRYDDGALHLVADDYTNFFFACIAFFHRLTWRFGEQVFSE